MGYGEAAPGAMLAIAPAVLSPSGQRRTLSEPFAMRVQKFLGAERLALGSAVHLMGGLRIMFLIMWLQSDARWRRKSSKKGEAGRSSSCGGSRPEALEV